MTRPCIASGSTRQTVVYLAMLWALAACSARAQGTEAPESRPAVEIVREARSGPVKGTIRLDRDEVAIPEAIQLTLTLESERGVEVALPNLDEIIRDFGVLNVERQTKTDPDGLFETLTLQCSLDPLAAGSWTLPPIEIPYVDERPRLTGETGRVEDKLVLAGITLTVTGTPADVKDVATLPKPWPKTLILWAVGVVAAMLAIAWWARRSRKPAVKMARRLAPLPPPVPAHIWAMAELSKLLAEKLPEHGRAQEFYYRINAIVREYLERRFGLRAPEQTSEEFIVAVSRSGDLIDRHKQLLQQFTAACDPVKYARAVPTQTDIDWVVDTARGFVEATTPSQVALIAPSTHREAEVAA